MSLDVTSHVQQLLDAGEFDKIAPFLDNAELESLELEPLNEWPIALHLLSHVYNNNLVNARFLWKRIPPTTLKSEEAEAAWTVVQVFWNRCFDQYNASLTIPEWSPSSKLLADAIAIKAVRSTLDLVSKTYSNISIGRLSSLLGCSQETALEHATEEGWNVHEDRIEVVKQEKDSLQMVPDGHLQKLAEILTHLES